MAAYDNVGLPAPPNIATAGNFAQQLFSMLSQAPKEYWAGQQQQYQQRQQNLFQNGLPLDANGNPDFYATLQKMIQAGGAPAAGQVLPMLQRQPILDAALREYQSGGATSTGPAASPAAAGPANIVPQDSGQPAAAGADAGESVRTLAAGIGGSDRDIPAPVMNRIALSLGLPDADATVPDGQLGAARARIAGYLQRAGGAGTPSAAAAGGVTQPGLQGDDNSTNQGTPRGIGGSAPISPAPTSSPAPWAPGGAMSGRFDAAYGNGGAPPTGGAAGMVPPGYDPRSYAEALKRRAEALRRQANMQGIIGIPTKAREDQAAAYDKQADAILEQLGKAGESTPEQKNLRSGATQRAEELKGEVSSGQKELDAINKLGNEAAVSNQKIGLARRFIDDPGFYSGPLEDINRRYKQFAASLGGDPNKGTPQEAFKKTINDLLSEQIRAMAGSGVGRVLLSEVQTMRDSIASLGMTPATNRLLLEELSRVHQAQMDIQQAANVYVEKHGHLDPGFQRIVAQYYRDHPLFSSRELRDPRLIAPPAMPAAIAADPVRIRKWAKANGLREGDPFVGENGKGPFVLRLDVHPRPQ